MKAMPHDPEPAAVAVVMCQTCPAAAGSAVQGCCSTFTESAIVRHSSVAWLYSSNPPGRDRNDQVCSRGRQSVA
ncbi:hypothetical protein [Dactylosporangium matsuzakiense]|uniref:hypothetical protein n=1 Tax=Dactylosporangium matsuzakiense TaxID=53360 RepID=UPI0021C46F81|nr:hypothetical protein [Dactylosporangium matsuzakiense]UWZ47788.1 hypothetical protein Dmats_16125 [Dactylosporangium matsuzakiense]